MSTFVEVWYSGRKFSVYCRACDRHVRFDIKGYIDAGHGDETTLCRRWRCSLCGGRGELSSSMEWIGPNLAQWLDEHRPRPRKLHSPKAPFLPAR